MIHLQNRLDDTQCYEAVRAQRWPEGIRCPYCGAAPITRQGRAPTQPARQKYRCTVCGRYFDHLIAGGIGIVVRVIGADVAGGLYARWLAKRAGLDEQP
ncbi:transposase [Azorhizophilus paspali]|uniref:Transposase n=1 Tax=Azorhizophilus paspali TaxID=69963 RepID=A0ABV6SR34_AZOPA